MNSLARLAALALLAGFATPAFAEMVAPAAPASKIDAGDTVYFGPEAEFFIFDDVRWSTDPHNTGYSYDSVELPANTGRE